MMNREPDDIDKAGNQFWYNIHGQLHRVDGFPALIKKNGDQFWYKNNLRHNENGPAVIWANGGRSWYINGLRHNENGPAIINSNGVAWFIDGKQLSEEEFKQHKIKQFIGNGNN